MSKAQDAICRVRGHDWVAITFPPTDWRGEYGLDVDPEDIGPHTLACARCTVMHKDII